MLSPCPALPPVECRDSTDLPADPPGRVIPIHRRKHRLRGWRPSGHASDCWSAGRRR